ncbi:MAG: hypothetical protein ACOYMN_08650 [Roseimicrobium sp.]
MNTAAIASCLPARQRWPRFAHTLAQIGACLLILSRAAAAPSPYFGIHVVDEQTGRGIPLVVLRTVNEIRCVTDNAGWVAWHEPGLMEREVWFHVSSPGYVKEKDGFGFAGFRVLPKAGETTTLRLQRTNIAERVGRLTGQGLYRDTELLGLPCPVPKSSNALVMGQDSVNATPYRNRIFWLWGDTNVARYPLGNYRSTCATTPMEATPERGLFFDYFVDPTDPTRPRQMLPMAGQGAVWLFGLLTVKDEAQNERLLAHYGRHLGLEPPVEHGLARFNDERGVFEKASHLPVTESWRFPQGQAVRVADASGERYYFSRPFLHTRVRATEHDVLQPSSYEALRFEAGTWRWQNEHPPTTQKDERALILHGSMDPDQARFQVLAAGSDAPVQIHTASVQWNAWRKRWVLIGVEQGAPKSPSYLGEVWYAESVSPEGPWRKAIKVASHPSYSFYNPIHHGFFDSEGGRVIYFEGTYTREFSGNPVATERYDYNQLLYRLDLADPKLQPAQ